MSGIVTQVPTSPSARPLRATADPWWLKCTIISLSLLFVGLFLLLPLLVVFTEAFRKGWAAYWESFNDPSTWSAIRVTFIAVAVAVPCNTAFGLAAAWCCSRFRFRGRGMLLSLVELPVWISPVVAGLVCVLVYGQQGLGPWLQDHDVQIIFALPGIILATIFVTFPFVARTIIPQMQAQGYAEEEAAMTLGAGGWTVFRRITLPKIKWSLIYGIILCNARSMGEFGAVSVVSGMVINRTVTMPLQIELLYNSFKFAPAFALASFLSLLALVTLLLKTYSEWATARQLQQALEPAPTTEL